MHQIPHRLPTARAVHELIPTWSLNMARVFISYHKHDQPIRGDLLQLDGTFLQSERLDITLGPATSGLAPSGAEYATLWADAPFCYQAGLNPAAKNDGTSRAYPANQIVKIVNLAPLSTKISATLLV